MFNNQKFLTRGDRWLRFHRGLTNLMWHMVLTMEVEPRKTTYRYSG